MLKSKITWIAFAVVALVGLGNTTTDAGIVTSNNIDGSDPSAFNTFTDGMFVENFVSASGISRGPTLIKPNGASAGTYQAVGWTEGALDINEDYFSFVITPDAGTAMRLTSFTYEGRAGGQGPTSFSFRSSLDGFASDLGVATESGTTINLGPEFDYLDSSIEFRFYAYNAKGTDLSASRYGIENYSFGGFTAVPEPSSMMLVSLAACSAFLTRKRRKS